MFFIYTDREIGRDSNEYLFNFHVLSQNLNGTSGDFNEGQVKQSNDE